MTQAETDLYTFKGIVGDLSKTDQEAIHDSIHKIKGILKEQANSDFASIIIGYIALEINAGVKL